MAGASSLLDEQGAPSQRWAQLGVIRASELGGSKAGALRREPARAEPTDPAADRGRTDPGRRVPASAGDPEGGSVLPVAAPLAGPLPWGGLRRGSTVAVGGSTSLVLAVLAEASRAGSWCALVGLPGMGVQAVAEAGLDLGRTALVPRPGPRPASVVAALVDGVDVVVLAGAARWSAGDRRRLASRARQQGAVLVAVGPWPGADAELHASGGTWSGLGDGGAGRLRSRRVAVGCAARGRPGEQRTAVLMPGPTGACAEVAEVGPEHDDTLPGPFPAAVAG